jgi:hypothetical protein
MYQRIKNVFTSFQKLLRLRAFWLLWLLSKFIPQTKLIPKTKFFSSTNSLKGSINWDVAAGKTKLPQKQNFHQIFSKVFASFEYYSWIYLMWSPIMLLFGQIQFTSSEVTINEVVNPCRQFAYCYHSVNASSSSLSQWNHIKWLQMNLT